MRRLLGCLGLGALACAGGARAPELLVLHVPPPGSATPSASAGPAPSGPEPRRASQHPGLPGSVEVTELRPGAGRTAEVGDVVEVDYEVRLADQSVFDSTEGRGGPVTFVVGEARVMPAVSQGVRGMRSGGVRRLVVPPGAFPEPRGWRTRVPRDATVVLILELREVRDGDE